MERWHHKVLTLCLIFIVIFLSAALPIKLSDYFERKGKKGLAVISWLMCFGGGVFFGTFLLHMIPEVHELVDEAILKPNNIVYPIAELIAGCGFFLMMFLEKLVMEIKTRKDKKQETKATNVCEEHGMPDLQRKQCVSIPEISVIAIRSIDSGNDEVVMKEQVTPIHLTSNGSVVPAQHQASNYEKQVYLEQNRGQENGHLPHYEHAHHHHHGHDHHHHDGHDHHESHHHHHHQEGPHSHADGSAAKSLVLLLALSLDCVFEGMSLGLQTDAGGVWKMVIAILSHEVVIAFSLGLQLMKHNSKRRTFFMALVYGLTCPFGIAIGTAVMEGAGQSMNTDLINGILQGITTGVFIYVTFFEILAHEISHDVKLRNLLGVFLGFGIMAGLATLHHHSHIVDSQPDNGNKTFLSQGFRSII